MTVIMLVLFGVAQRQNEGLTLGQAAYVLATPAPMTGAALRTGTAEQLAVKTCSVQVRVMHSY